MCNYSEIVQRQAFLQEILLSAINKVGGSQLETLSLVFEEDHFHMLLESMKEVKEGKVVSFQNAFSDLD